MAELKTCEVCGGQFKNLGVHAKKHGVVEPSSATAVTPSKFLSPRSRDLCVVIKPIEWTMVATPAGSRQMQTAGKKVQFVNGEVTTSDPEIIEFLEETYKDARFPIISCRKMQSRIA